MASKTRALAISDKRIINKIYLIRGRKVMIDRDLAELYGVETRALNQAVRRNRRRFPSDFMFQMSMHELDLWRSQIVISNRERMGLRKPPLAFTEQGVAMLSSVLNSERAIHVNIQIIRTFTHLRAMLATHRELRDRLDTMERKYDKRFRVVFDALRELLKPPDEPRREIGFRKRG
jgi:hypothetical protein